MKKNFLPALLFLYCYCGFAQVDSVIKTTYVREPNMFFNVKENHLGEDTTLDLHYNYILPAFNGNLGLPSQDFIIGEKNVSPLGFRFMVPSYRDQFYSENDIAYYNTKNPYTRAFALVGQRQEQMIRLIHTQNIKQFNYLIKFNRYKCNGFYLNQLAITDNFISTFNYKTKKENYKLYLHFLYNKVRHQENGGIADETGFRDSLYLENKELLNVNLSNARRATRNIDAGFSQFFRTRNRTKAFGKVEDYIFHKFTFNDDYFVYNDDSTSFSYYQNIVYNDKVITHDSVRVSKISNEIGFNQVIIPVKDTGLVRDASIYFSVKHEWAQVKQLQYDSVFSNVILKLGGRYKIKNGIFSAKAEAGVYGQLYKNASYQADYFLPVKWKKSELKISFNHEVRMQDYFFKRYYGNNFQWKNDYANAENTYGNVKFSVFSGRLFAENNLRSFKNYIYFDSANIPLINYRNIYADRITLGGKIKFGHFHFNNALSYQYSSNDSVVRLPKYFTQSQLYYEGRLFKKNLWLQVGTQCTYYSQFLANQYIPALNVYRLQEKTQYGNYPFFDFFISAEIKPVRFFFKLDHINQGLTGGNYLLGPGMPMPDRSFKFGFTWLFWD